MLCKNLKPEHPMVWMAVTVTKRYYMIISPKLTSVAPIHLLNRHSAGKIRSGRTTTKIAIYGLINLMGPPHVKISTTEENGKTLNFRA